MSRSLAAAVALYAGCVTLLALGAAVRRRGLGRVLAAAMIVVGAGAALNALVAIVGIATGARPAEPGPFAGYLVVSVLAAPMGWRYARASASGWDAAIVALAAATRCRRAARRRTPHGDGDRRR